MSRDNKAWEKRERKVAGLGSNRSRAKARKAAKRFGNKLARKKFKISS